MAALPLKQHSTAQTPSQTADACVYYDKPAERCVEGWPSMLLKHQQLNPNVADNQHLTSHPAA